MQTNIPKITCYIKVIINSRTEECFSVRWALYPHEKVNVKIITSSVNRLRDVVEKMKKCLSPARYAYNVKFNWKNAPVEVKSDNFFVADMYKLFGNSPGLDSITVKSDMPDEILLLTPDDFTDVLDNSVDIVRSYIQQYGNAPDLKKRTPKQVKKIHNYIKSVSAFPQMTQEQALKIADQL